MDNQNRAIGNYLLLASSFLLLHAGADAEIIYTDLDPDLVINDDGEAFGVDMDNNGELDFAFLKATWAFETYWNYNLEYVTQLWCGAYGTSANEMAAYVVTFGSAAYSSFTQQFPYNLSGGVLISDEYNFENDGYQLMAVRAFNEEGDLVTFDGDWWPEFEDHFIGVHFIDSDEKYHYGWIRCSVQDSIETLVIKDYAFETIEEKPIYTGDTIGEYVNAQDQFVFEPEVYCANNLVTIELKSLDDFPMILISDINGSVVYKNDLTDLLTTIPAEQFSTGVYFIVIQTAKNRVVKKIEVI